jgi:Xaa-Pro aminopeptidase
LLDWQKLELIKSEALNSIQASKIANIQESYIFSDHEEFDTKKGFKINLGEDVLKKKEEIENIYKEEDKKKERLKYEYNDFVNEMTNKINELKTLIRQEQALNDVFNLNKLQKNPKQIKEKEEIEKMQKIGKRNSIDSISEENEMGSQPLKIELKRYSETMSRYSNLKNQR